ncbi:hypothetical protein BDQ17DRAFT_1247381 [Cyathus striatus]|nr:hypothetical protein BDQ17DRAFT_1247381 [Cyathus striatus]
MIDNFVYDKKGEYKHNTVSIETLQLPTAEGGHNLIDLQARNEAIKLMKLRTYTNPVESQWPPWTKLADHILSLSAKSSVQCTVGHAQRRNFLLQGWPVYLQAETMPKTLQRMLRAADKHKVKFAPTEITPQMKLAMPFWYHLARAPGKNKTYREEYARCQIEVHEFWSMGEMAEHASKNWAPGHINEPMCQCTHCVADRRTGCINPIKCRASANRKLKAL